MDFWFVSSFWGLGELVEVVGFSTLLDLCLDEKLKVTEKLSEFLDLCLWFVHKTRFRLVDLCLYQKSDNRVSCTVLYFRRYRNVDYLCCFGMFGCIDTCRLRACIKKKFNSVERVWTMILFTLLGFMETACLYLNSVKQWDVNFT